jgi:hypothetical protein
MVTSILMSVRFGLIFKKLHACSAGNLAKIDQFVYSRLIINPQIILSSPYMACIVAARPRLLTVVGVPFDGIITVA